MIEQLSSHHYFDYKVKSNKIYVIILISIFIGVSVLPFIYVDISNQSRGVIRSAFENTNLTSLITAKINSVRIRENKLVEKGDTLIFLNTTVIDYQLVLTREQICQNENFIADFQNLLSNKLSLKTDLVKSNYAKHKARIREIKTHFQQVQKEFEISAQLFSENVIAKLEYLKSKNAFERLGDKLQHIKEEDINEWHNKIIQLKNENLKLISQLRQLETKKSLYYLIAPISGTITNFSGIQAQSHTYSGDIIATIAPNDQLIVECLVSANDIGHIYKNQKIVYQLDAFNFNQWGFANGKVEEISTELKELNNQAMFSIRCSLNTDKLVLKNGQSVSLKKGMTLTARLFLTRRNLWQLLFDKLDNWTNPLLNTN